MPERGRATEKEKARAHCEKRSLVLVGGRGGEKGPLYSRGVHTVVPKKDFAEREPAIFQSFREILEVQEKNGKLDSGD